MPGEPLDLRESRGRELGAIQQQLKGICSDIREIKEHLQRQNGRIGKVEQWQAETAPSIDTLIERVNSVTDKSDVHQSWIDEQKGSHTARLRMFSELATACGVVILLIKLFFFHN